MLCSRCRYWDNSPAGTYQSPDHAVVAEFGRCRVKAPHLPPSGLRALWPTTHANDWCGEFEDRGDSEL